MEAFDQGRLLIPGIVGLLQGLSLGGELLLEVAGALAGGVFLRSEGVLKRLGLRQVVLEAFDQGVEVVLHLALLLAFAQELVALSGELGDLAVELSLRCL